MNGHRPLALLLLVGLALWGSQGLWLPLVVPPAVRYEEQPWPVLNPDHTIRQGEDLLLKVSRCGWWPWDRGEPIHSQVTRELQNLDTGEVLQISAGEVDVPLGCHTVPFRITYLPPDLPPGRYVLGGWSTSQGIYTVRLHWQTEIFSVVAKEARAP